MPQAIISNFAIWLSSSNSPVKGDPVKLLTWLENNKGIVWDKNGGKEETERVTEMKRKWEGEGARDSDAKWGKLTSIGTTKKHWGNEQITEEQW